MGVDDEASGRPRGGDGGDGGGAVTAGPDVWSWRREAPLLALVGAMFLASAVAWPFAADEIPMHWNASGEIDRMGGKLEGLLLLPSITLGLWALLAFLPKIDPGRRNYASFSRAYLFTRLGILAFMALIHAAVLAVAVGWDVDVFIVFPVGTAVLFFVLGNQMPRFRPNYFAGIRTPWTLASARSWTATHRLGGRLFMGASVLFLAMGFVRAEWFIAVLLGTTLLGVTALAAYSYLAWRDDPDRVPVGMVQPSSEE